MSLSEKFNLIKQNLEMCSRVTQYSNKIENQAETLTHSIIDIEKSMNELVKNLIPKLHQNNLSSEEVDDIILDIGEEFRHILYHINDTKVYDYLKSE